MRTLVVVAVALVVAGCAREAEPPSTTSEPAPVSTPTPTPTAEAVLMPDLIGLPANGAMGELGRIQTDLQLRLDWAAPVRVGCETRPGTVVRQQPAAGTALHRHTEVVIRTGEMDVAVFRGPCEPEDGEVGPVRGAEAALARDFYRFAADPTQGGVFGTGSTWLGIESGLWETTVAEEDRYDLGAWSMDTNYAEASGPMAPLDLLARTGGYFEVHHGVEEACTGDAAPPEDLETMRALSITPPSDVVGSCMEAWAITLFVDSGNVIRGVALRMGSP